MGESQQDAGIPPVIAWASRNSGIILFLLLFSVAMIEGVAIYASKRKAAASAPVEAPVDASLDAARDSSAPNRR